MAVLMAEIQLQERLQWLHSMLLLKKAWWKTQTGWEKSSGER